MRPDWLSIVLWTIAGVYTVGVWVFIVLLGTGGGVSPTQQFGVVLLVVWALCIVIGVIRDLLRQRRVARNPRPGLIRVPTSYDRSRR
jgi:hypothetical protein